MSFPVGTGGKELARHGRRGKRSISNPWEELAHNGRRGKRSILNPWVGKIPQGRAQQPTPVFLPGESHGWRNLMGYSLKDHRESDTME